MNLSVVVPIKDERDNIGKLHERLHAALEPLRLPYEMIFVDDGSSDATWKKISEAHRQDERVRGLRHARNCGQSAALWTGLQASRNASVLRGRVLQGAQRRVACVGVDRHAVRAMVEVLNQSRVGEHG